MLSDCNLTLCRLVWEQALVRFIWLHCTAHDTPCQPLSHLMSGQKINFNHNLAATTNSTKLDRIKHVTIGIICEEHIRYELD